MEDRDSRDKLLARVDKIRPYVKRAILAAAPTAAIARAFDLKPRSIIPITMAAAGLGAADYHIERSAKESRAIARKLPNYAQAAKTAGAPENTMRERATVAGYLRHKFHVPELPSLREAEKEAQAGISTQGLPWCEAPILAKLAGFKPELDWLTIAQCHDKAR